MNNSDKSKKQLLKEIELLSTKIGKLEKSKIDHKLAENALNESEEKFRILYEASQDAIMMLGCEKMFVALFTEHIPLKDVASYIEYKKLKRFFLDLHNSIPNEKIAVLGLNPHAGDNGVLGDEELRITKAIKSANKKSQPRLSGHFNSNMV